ncbi:GNAT family N-acetyltransferase [Chromobacterium violaceum]|uniref:GNAT family N-acetyltransferase n=1 Tax=Chromobacterium violaceum TaxID=536 RepID=UPI0009D95A91|nr:GNAT family N-acetyltransferase [Chromobacterium violaceum]OQS11999.1 GNAT family N-acetyltransferase [Chromobacterium violaceum]OQS28565.1 GNAT family N-acetyltransferase [Chromobacterium violaceum]OQS51023.1 GNAT family N-acetyltransferase [Chromobacterium violaceum]OQS53024.1 GNAT family N-acetyltransferase [Chromobacterium violaceum]QRO34706.1 N-acetyltransferase [Chromobacterium violaceum]
MQLQLYDGVAAIAQSAWPAAGGAGVFVGREWLAALEETGCVGGATGWLPLPLALERDGQAAGLAPAYLKRHNRGEYVFDWSWAEAYARAGLDYYPKLVVASPFTPVTGRRVLGGADAQARLIAGLRQLVDDNGLSSAHVLFPTAEEAARLEEAGWLLREGVQFHWRNQAYADFDDFLAALSRDKRKKIRQERRKVAEAGVAVRALEGGAILDADWQLFFRCYRQTYLERHSSPYLNLDFFRRIGERLSGHCLMFVASREGRDIAASLCIRDGDALYGRYWGALEEVPCLHFELCYYQGLEYAISRGLSVFEGGAQGEHKQARGFEPARTVSAHYIADPRFRSAIADWLRRERDGVADYVNQLFSHSAYKTLAREE